MTIVFPESLDFSSEMEGKGEQGENREGKEDKWQKEEGKEMAKSVQREDKEEETSDQEVEEKDATENDKDGEDIPEQADESSKDVGSGYICTCFDEFLSHGRLLKHKKKTGHGCARCIVCQEWIPSKSALKHHKKVSGHEMFEGKFEALREWSKKKVNEKKKRAKAGSGRTESENSSFLSGANEYKEIVPPPLPVSFLPDVEIDVENRRLTESFLDRNGIRANIPEAYRAPLSFVPFNPFLHLPQEKEVVVTEAKKVEKIVEKKQVQVVEPKLIKKVIEKEKEVVPKKQKAEGTVLDFWIEATSSDLSAHGNKSFSDQAEATKDDLVEKATEDGIVGIPPSEWLLEQIQNEWTSSSSLQKEWDYVNKAVPAEASDRELTPGDGRDEGHEGMTLLDFAELPESQIANLDECEVLALRLYTGPGFAAINASCRTGTNLFSATAYCLECAILKLATSADKVCDAIKITTSSEFTPSDITPLVERFGRVDTVHMPVDKVTRQRKGVFFIRYRDKNDATAAIANLNLTQLKGHVLEVAWAPIGKAKNNTFRGLSGKMPAKFVSAYNEGRKMEEGDAIADGSFLSTTKSRDVALGGYGGNIIFVIRGKEPLPGLLRGGADIEWISQFPNEEEVLYPRFTELWYNSPLKRCVTREFSMLPGCNKFLPATTGAQYGKTPCQNCEFTKSQHPIASGGTKVGFDKQIFEFSAQYGFNKRFCIPNLPSMRCKALRGIKLGAGELQNNKRPPK